MGRHSSRDRRRATWIVALGSAVLLVIAGIVVWSQDSLDPILPPGVWARNCTPTRLDVVADPSIAPALQKSAAGFDAVTPCVKTTVRAQKSADTASVIAVGGDPKADVWVPDSPAWEQRMQVTAWSLIRKAPAAEFGPAIATTPLVFAAPAKDAAAFGHAKVGWRSITDGSLPALLPEPAQNGASVTALAEIRSAVPSGDPLGFSGAMIELGRNIPSSTADAFDAAEKAQTPTVVITTEQAVVDRNAESTAHQFFALYPSEGTVDDSYPYVRVAGPSTGNSTKDSLISALERQFSSDARPLAATGFRTPHGDVHFAANGVLANAPRTAPGMDGGAQVGVLQQWSTITVRSRMLVVVDVSGSMSEDAGGGLTRIGVFQKAAMNVLQLFPPQTEMGMWVFSTHQAGDQPWLPLTPIAPIGDPAHAQDIANIVASLPGRISGDTGLYDTTLAAVNAVRNSYDPQMVNSVLVVTDGVNDDPSGISLDTLLSQLKATADPNKPVPVIMVGMGPNTDLAAMSEIALATVGAAYSAEKPQDLSTVLVDALAQRTCRPYCS